MFCQVLSQGLCQVYHGVLLKFYRNVFVKHIVRFVNLIISPS